LSHIKNDFLLDNYSIFLELLGKMIWCLIFYCFWWCCANSPCWNGSVYSQTNTKMSNVWSMVVFARDFFYRIKNLALNLSLFQEQYPKVYCQN